MSFTHTVPKSEDNIGFANEHDARMIVVYNKDEGVKPAMEVGSIDFTALTANKEPIDCHHYRDVEVYFCALEECRKVEAGEGSALVEEVISQLSAVGIEEENVV